MWTFMSVHAVSVSCVQTVTHGRKHSIRLDEHIQTGGAGDEEKKKKKTYAHPLHFGNFVKFIFTNHVVKCVCKWSKFLFVVR